MTAARRHRREVEDLLREAAPRVLAAVVRRFGDFADSEDAVQEAMIDAARQWPAEGHAGEPDRVADRGGLATDDRPDPRRLRPAGARGAARGRAGARPGRRGRRHPGADLHVLPAGALARLGDRPHPARGRRPHHRRDRRRLPRPGDDDGTADRAGEADRRRGRRAVRPAGAGGTGGATARRARRPLPDLQRGLRGQRRPRPRPHRALRRGDPPDPDRAAGAARRSPRSAACWR